jgi:hypothetical protein
MMDLRENGFPLSPAGHFVNVNLEQYEVKASFAAKFAHHSLVMIRVVQHAHLLLLTLRRPRDENTSPLIQ